MFRIINLVQMTIALSIVNKGASSCENTWTTYKDGLCIKGFTSVATFDDARTFCSLQGDEISQATLVTVQDSGMQNILESYTNGITGTVWLGARYNNESSEFRWENGEPLTYSNWQSGYPGNLTDSDICIELLPTQGRKWIHVTCQKRNLVICQKRRPWTLEDAVKKIISLEEQTQVIRDELNEANNEVLKIREELGEANNQVVKIQEELDNVNSRVVPVGSIYIEYYNQSSPLSLWPNLTWEDVTGAYAGLFFRALGDGSENWGVTQTECSPRITEMSYTERTSSQYPSPNIIPENGWSPFGWVGYNAASYSFYEGLRFHTAGCEVRPRNQAVRIWKRTA